MKVIIFCFILSYIYMTVKVYNALEHGLQQDEEKANRVREIYETGSQLDKITVNLVVIGTAFLWPMVIISSKLKTRKDNKNG